MRYLQSGEEVSIISVLLSPFILQALLILPIKEIAVFFIDIDLSMV